MGQFSTDIQHVKGKNNVVTDALSRVQSVRTTVDMKELAKVQISDRELQKYRERDTALKLERLPIPGTDIEIYCDTTIPKPRPFVTEKFRYQIFDSLHSMSHSGIKNTVKLVAQRLVWPKIRKDCCRWAQTYIPCQQSKVTKHNRALVGNFTHQFEHVYLDIVGPLPISRGYRYCLTMRDRITRWPEVVPK